MTRVSLALILALQVALGALYATGVPPYNAPDEPAHMNYVRDLAERGEFPVLQSGDWDAELLELLKAARFPPDLEIATVRYEGHQPPLYYLLVAPVARATVGLGERGQLVATRLATVLIGAVALVAVYLVAGLLFPSDPLTRLAAVGLAAFIPMHLAVAASVSNDLLAELVLTLVLWRAILALRDGLDGRAAFVLGALVGLGMLTKLSCYVAIPLAALTIWLTARRRARAFAIATVTTLVVAGPWLARGVWTYGIGDPLGLRRHDEVVVGQTLTGAVDPAIVSRHVATLFRSFWGQFGWMGVLMDGRIYEVLLAASLAIGLGVLLWLMPWGGFWREMGPFERRGFGVAGLLVLAVGLGTVFYNLTYLQPQGRYLFPAMSGIAVLTTGGVRELCASRQRPALYLLAGVGLVGLDLVALYRFVIPALTL